MGKRQRRIKKTEIPEKITDCIGKEINLIQENSITLHGKILKITGDTVLFQDSIRKKHQLPISQIQEIQIDYSATY